MSQEKLKGFILSNLDKVESWRLAINARIRRGETAQKRLREGGELEIENEDEIIDEVFDESMPQEEILKKNGFKELSDGVFHNDDGLFIFLEKDEAQIHIPVVGGFPLKHLSTSLRDEHGDSSETEGIRIELGFEDKGKILFSGFNLKFDIPSRTNSLHNFCQDGRTSFLSESELEAIGFNKVADLSDREGVNVFDLTYQAERYKPETIRIVTKKRVPIVLLRRPITGFSAAKIVGNGSILKRSEAVKVPALIMQDQRIRFKVASTADTTLIGEMGREESPTLLKSQTFEDLDITPFEAFDNNGFKVGGVNESQKTIRNLKSINGIPIIRLENHMRSKRLRRKIELPELFERIKKLRGRIKKKLNKWLIDEPQLIGESDTGFIGDYEGLIDLLIADNELVTQQLQLTHQDIARPLKYVRALYKKLSVGTGNNGEFEYNGVKYSVKVKDPMCSLGSPFGDKTGSNLNIEVTNMEKGKTISFSGLMPDMIERYGFYEGKDIPYRVNPEEVVEVFSSFFN